MTLAVFAAAMWIGWKLIVRERQPGYVCPQCGTRAANRHSEGCSWGR